MDPKLKAMIDQVTAKRPRTVLDHILEHGEISTAELRDRYGYSHPPRAIADVRDHGIPVKQTRSKGTDGRQMAVYKIDEEGFQEPGKAGRRAFPKVLKVALVERDGKACSLCGGHFPVGALQIDHRVPFEIAGEADVSEAAEFMLVCGSCNRTKSWSCESCPNRVPKDRHVCETCMWASPTSYLHIATEPKRRLDVVWEGADEVRQYDQFAASRTSDEVRDALKEVIRNVRRGPKR